MTTSTLTVDAKNGDLIIATKLDLRGILEQQLVGFVSPRYDNEPADAATKSLASSLVCVPQIAQALGDVLVNGATEDLDAMGTEVTLDLRRRVAVALGPEGETFAQVAKTLQETEATVKEQESAIRQMRDRITELERHLAGSETARRAANANLKDATGRIDAAVAVINELIDQTSKGDVPNFAKLITTLRPNIHIAGA